MATNACYAFSELYYVRNATESDIKPIIEESLSNYNYNISKYNPYYATSYNGSDYVVAIVQQSGNNVFYYYQSGDNTKINKRILKNFRRNDYPYEESQNASVLSVYDDLARRTMSNSGPVNNSYVFSDPYSFEPQEQTTGVYDQRYDNTTLQGRVAQVDRGTKLQAYLQNALNTSTANVGDQVIAVLTTDLTYNGRVVAPQGSMVYGTISYARHATYASRNGRIVINFNQLVTPDNKTYNISTEEVDFSVTNDGKLKSVASDAAVGAVVGGLAGLLIGAITGNIGASAAIGAGVGAGGALIGNAAERGVDAEIPSFTEIEITLTKSFSVTVTD